MADGLEATNLQQMPRKKSRRAQLVVLEKNGRPVDRRTAVVKSERRLNFGER
jgi:hypothetical protein